MSTPVFLHALHMVTLMLWCPCHALLLCEGCLPNEPSGHKLESMDLHSTEPAHSIVELDLP